MEREMIEKPEEKEFFLSQRWSKKKKKGREFLFSFSSFTFVSRLFLGDLWRLIRNLHLVGKRYLYFYKLWRWYEKEVRSFMKKENFLYKSSRKEKEVVTYEFQREFLINLEIPNKIFN